MVVVDKTLLLCQPHLDGSGIDLAVLYLGEDYVEHLYASRKAT